MEFSSNFFSQNGFLNFFSEKAVYNCNYFYCWHCSVLISFRRGWERSIYFLSVDDTHYCVYIWSVYISVHWNFLIHRICSLVCSMSNIYLSSLISFSMDGFGKNHSCLSWTPYTLTQTHHFCIVTAFFRLPNTFIHQNTVKI